MAQKPNELMSDKNLLLYEQDGTHFRALNEILWRIPALAMTLTGGLWFGIATIDTQQYLIKIGMFLLSAAGNVAFMFAIWRLRIGVMERYLVRMSQFSTLPSVEKPPYVPKVLVESNYAVIALFSFMLLMASVISVVGAIGTTSEWLDFVNGRHLESSSDVPQVVGSD